MLIFMLSQSSSAVQYDFAVKGDWVLAAGHEYNALDIAVDPGETPQSNGDLAVQVAIGGSNNSGSGTVIPDNADEVDAGDMVEGFGVDGLASGSSSASG